MSDLDQVIINSTKDIDFALSLIAEDDPERYGDVAEVLRRAAGRFDYLAEKHRESV